MASGSGLVLNVELYQPAGLLRLHGTAGNANVGVTAAEEAIGVDGPLVQAAALTRASERSTT
jgi:hypothetical protein